MRAIRLVLIALVLLAGLCLAADLSTVNVAGPPGPSAPYSVGKTAREMWYGLRTVTASDTALNATQRNWNYASSRFLALREPWNSVSLCVLGYGDGDGAGDPANGTFTWTLYGVRYYGPPQIVATGTWAIGAMEATHDPASGAAYTGQTNYKWGELPVISTDYWPATTTASGTTDQVGTLNVDPLGCFGLYLEVTNLANVTTLYIFVTGR